MVSCMLEASTFNNMPLKIFKESRISSIASVTLDDSITSFAFLAILSAVSMALFVFLIVCFDSLIISSTLLSVLDAVAAIFESSIFLVIFLKFSKAIRIFSIALVMSGVVISVFVLLINLSVLLNV